MLTSLLNQTLGSFVKPLHGPRFPQLQLGARFAIFRPDMAKDPHAAALGRKGGKARMENLTAEERRQLARDAGRRSGEVRREKAKKKAKKSRKSGT